jgi:hypothetical protein
MNWRYGSSGKMPTLQDKALSLNLSHPPPQKCMPSRAKYNFLVYILFYGYF